MIVLNKIIFAVSVVSTGFVGASKKVLSIYLLQLGFPVSKVTFPPQVLATGKILVASWCLKVRVQRKQIFQLVIWASWSHFTPDRSLTSVALL